jgi:hypothetical protein
MNKSKQKTTAPIQAPHPVAPSHSIAVGMGRSNGRPVVEITFSFDDQSRSMLVSSEIGSGLGSCLLAMAGAVAKMEGGAA